MLVARNQVSLVLAALAAWDVCVPGYDDPAAVVAVLAADAGLEAWQAEESRASLANIDEPHLVVLAACRAWLRGSDDPEVRLILDEISGEALSRIPGWHRAVSAAFGL